MVGDFQMRHRVEPQGRLKQLRIEFEELTGIAGAGVGDDQADVQVVRTFGKLVDEALLREVHRYDAVLDIRILRWAAREIGKAMIPASSRVDPARRNEPFRDLLGPCQAGQAGSPTPPDPETPACRSCRRDRSDHVRRAPKRLSVRAW